MQERDYRLLKELALEFVDNENPSIFMAILLKVDRLLLYTIHKARKAKPYLRKVDLRDLYQDAIVGLYNAILKTREDEPGKKIVYWITRYVTNEIAKHNKRTNKVSFPFSVSDIAFQVHLYSSDMPQSGTYIDQIKDKLAENTPVYKNLEAEFTRDRFYKLIEDDVISLEEYAMLTMYFVSGMTYKAIAKQAKCSGATVSRRIESTLHRLRYEFRRRGWECDL